MHIFLVFTLQSVHIFWVSSKRPSLLFIFNKYWLVQISNCSNPYLFSNQYHGIEMFWVKLEETSMIIGWAIWKCWFGLNIKKIVDLLNMFWYEAYLLYLDYFCMALRHSMSCNVENAHFFTLHWNEWTFFTLYGDTNHHFYYSMNGTWWNIIQRPQIHIFSHV